MGQGEQAGQAQLAGDGGQAVGQEAEAQALPAVAGKKRIVIWDREVDYVAMYQALLKSMVKEKHHNNRCYAAIALVALRNGLRSSEAIEAFKAAIRSGADLVEVRTRKKKRVQMRKAKIPAQVKPALEACRHLLAVDDEHLNWRFAKWLRKRHKINPHSLRYSFITFAVASGFDSALVAKVINHSRIDQIETYIQRRFAEKHLLENDFFEL